MNITIYTKTNCPWCIEVLNFLQENRAPFTEKNMVENPEFFNECLEKTGQIKAPTLEIDGKFYPDSDVEELKKILNLKN